MSCVCMKSWGYQTLYAVFTVKDACREQVYGTAYNVWYPHGFMHTHDILEALTPIEVESQNETHRMHALMTGEMS